MSDHKLFKNLIFYTARNLYKLLQNKQFQIGRYLSYFEIIFYKAIAKSVEFVFLFNAGMNFESSLFNPTATVIMDSQDLLWV